MSYSIDQLKSALVQADAAGDTQSAQILADQLANQQADEYIQAAKPNYAEDVATGVISGAAKLADELVDPFKSFGAWAGGLVGAGDGTYTPHQSETYFPKPTTEAGKIASSLSETALPAVTGWGLGEAVLPTVDALGTAGNFIARQVAGSVGSQAMLGDVPDPEQTALDVAISMGTHGLIHLGKAGIAKLGKNATEAEITAAKSVAGAEDAEARRIMSDLSPEALGYALTQQGAERDAVIKAISDQTGKQFAELKAAIEAADNGVSTTLAGLAKQGLRGDLDAVAKAANINEERLKIAQELGLNTDAIPASFLSDNRQFIELYQALRKMPGTAMSNMEIEALKQTSELADKMITDFGGMTDLSQLDQSIRDEAGSLIDTMKLQADMAYESIMSKTPPTAEAPISNTLAFIRGKLTKLGGKEGLLPEAARKILKELSPEITPSGIVNPTVGAVEAVRMDIGRAISKLEGPYVRDGGEKLRPLYAAMTDDSERAFARLGMDYDVQQAKQLVARRIELEHQSVNLFGRDIANSILPKLKDAVASATQGNAAKITKLMGSLPPSQRPQVAASALHYLFNAGARGGDRALAIPGFVKGYEGLMRNSVAKEELLKYLTKEERGTLHNFYTFAKGVDNAVNAVPATGIVGTITKEFEAASTMAEKIISGDVGAKTAFIDKALSSIPGINKIYAMPKHFVKSVAREAVGAAPGERAKKAADMLGGSEYQALAQKYATRKTASELAIKQADAALKSSKKYKAWYDTLSSAEKYILDKVGPYKTFAYWGTLQYAKDKMGADSAFEPQPEVRITIDKGYNDTK